MIFTSALVVALVGGLFVVWLRLLFQVFRADPEPELSPCRLCSPPFYVCTRHSAPHPPLGPESDRLAS